MTQVTRDILYKATFCEDIIDKIIDYAFVVDSEMLIRLHQARLHEMYEDAIDDLDTYQWFDSGLAVAKKIYTALNKATVEYQQYCKENELQVDTIMIYGEEMPTDTFLYKRNKILNLKDDEDQINNVCDVCDKIKNEYRKQRKQYKFKKEN